MAAEIKVWHARDGCAKPLISESARTFGLTNSRSGGSADCGTNGPANHGTGDSSRGGLLFDGCTAGGRPNSDGDQGKCECKALHDDPPAIWSSQNAIISVRFR